MRVDALTLEGWRNYQRQQLTFDDGCNVIYGENAQGKTNLLEAIVYLSCGKSPRAHGDRELIGFDRQDALLVGQIFSRQREFVTDIRLSRSKRRSMTVNGVKAKNGAALSDVLHTVFFAPEDLFLIRAGAAERRRFMDMSLCQLRPRYAEALSAVQPPVRPQDPHPAGQRGQAGAFRPAAGVQRGAVPQRGGAHRLPGAVLRGAGGVCPRRPL